jgi:SAM-dependent methyltransferase
VSELDDPSRAPEIRARILGKPSLKKLYEEFYAAYARCLARCPRDGVALELGSGAGFAKEAVPDLVTSDILPYEGVDLVMDAMALPHSAASLRMIAMINVFHHIPDVSRFLREAERTLKPGGRILIVDQHPGWIGGPVYRYLHHEPFDPATPDWKFQTSGPLSGANGALAWIVFVRDRARFEREFPTLQLERYRPHTPLRYWLAGGLKRWSLLPGFAWSSATAIDSALIRIAQDLGSFVEIEIKAN